MQLQQLHRKMQDYPVRVKKMPVLFVGHGYPLNAVTIGTAVSINPLPRRIIIYYIMEKNINHQSWSILKEIN